MTYTRRRCSEKGDRRLKNGKIGEKIKPIKILGEEEAAAHIPAEGKCRGYSWQECSRTQLSGGGQLCIAENDHESNHGWGGLAKLQGFPKWCQIKFMTFWKIIFFNWNQPFVWVKNNQFLENFCSFIETSIETCFGDFLFMFQKPNTALCSITAGPELHIHFQLVRHWILLKLCQLVQQASFTISVLMFQQSS